MIRASLGPSLVQSRFLIPSKVRKTGLAPLGFKGAFVVEAPDGAATCAEPGHSAGCKRAPGEPGSACRSGRPRRRDMAPVHAGVWDAAAPESGESGRMWGAA